MMEKRKTDKGSQPATLKPKRVSLSSKHIEELTLFDNIFMGAAFDGQIELTQKVLRIIMRKPDLTVLSVKCERSFIHVGGRSIRLDVFARDDAGRYYNIEVQRAESGADFRRMRFHASMITSKLLQAGQDFKETPDLVVIFICETDIFKAGLPYYEIGRYNYQTGKPFDDGEQIVVVNGSIQDDTPLGTLMHDFRCSRAEDAKIKEVRDRLAYMKNSKEEQTAMGGVFERWHDELNREQNEERVRKMLHHGKMTIEEIAEVVPELSLDEIRAIEEQMMVLA